jgi:UDPglucose 6-dehydrogenase
MGLDHRIGGKFLHPGPGYGGSCFPKDTRALLETGREHGQTLHTVAAAAAVNEGRATRMAEKVRASVGNLSGAVIGLLGLSFKPNTDDLRESAAVAVAEALVSAGATVRAYDPVSMPAARAQGVKAAFCENEYDAAAGADALVVATEWNQFRHLDFAAPAVMRAPVVVDLRNV